MYPINAFANVYRINVMEEREGQSEGERAVAWQPAHVDYRPCGGGAGDETIRDIAGHMSKQMLKHYSHTGLLAQKCREFTNSKSNGRILGKSDKW